MSEAIEYSLDNFDLTQLSDTERLVYDLCHSQSFSKRASVLYLIDNIECTTYDLKELKQIINEYER